MADHGRRLGAARPRRSLDPGAYGYIAGVGRRRVDCAGEPRRLRPAPHPAAHADRQRRARPVGRGPRAEARLRRSCSRRSACSRSPTTTPSRRSARRAPSSGVPMVLSGAATHSLEEVAATGCPRWYQLYWPNDRELCESFVAARGGAGYSAIVVTLDTLTLGWRPRDLRAAYLPFLQGRRLRRLLQRPGVPGAARQTAGRGSAHRGGDDALALPEPRTRLGRPRLAARTDVVAAPREGHPARRGRTARARARCRRRDRLEPRRPAGGRRGRGARRAGRGAGCASVGRRADGRRDSLRRRHRQGASRSARMRCCSGGRTSTRWRSAAAAASRS